MKDKDTKLIWEAYGSYEEDRQEHEEEIPGHDDTDPVYDDVRKQEVADEVKHRFDIDVEWIDKPGEDSGEWHRSDIHTFSGQESRPVTDDELEKIMIIEDPERALERWPSLRKHPELFNSAFNDNDEEEFPPENGRRY
jgi:hypothetical protein